MDAPTIAIALSVVLPLLGFAAAWGLLGGRIEALRRDVDRHDKERDDLKVELKTAIAEGFESLRRELHAAGVLKRSGE